MLLYLDSSAIVKRYIIEAGSNLVNEIYSSALSGDAFLSFSIWNIGKRWAYSISIIGELNRDEELAG